ncbi:flagellar basal body-associated FliL family protein [Cellvibrio sp. NN19]|uniref:flagellar basal body-associated FliL family protein n=1 Tax=Cellvibrio chitinivorans TaxID=3102792 RepID=UPI002B40E32E|nr:flagellar basal body-associated FliL family protein [Cellvibrio sp. NN19]
MTWVNKCLVTAIGAVLAVQVMASGGGGAKMAEGVNYIPLEPALVVNYGGPGGKPRYVKADLSLRAENAEDATEIMHHLPLIRDRLVSILSAQPEEIVSSVDGREYLRVFALAEINKALLKVEGHDVAHDEHPVAKAMPAKKADADDHAKPETSSETNSAPTIPSVADVKPVKGPASDLYFNNFVVQK